MGAKARAPVKARGVETESPGWRLNSPAALAVRAAAVPATYSRPCTGASRNTPVMGAGRSLPPQAARLAVASAPSAQRRESGWPQAGRGGEGFLGI